MPRLKLTDDWWTAPATSEDGQLILVTGRRGMQPVIDLGVYVYRIEVTWKYDPRPNGLPKDATARIMDEVTEAFKAVMRKDPTAILTGIYTGAGERNWVFYARSLYTFQGRVNKALEPFETLPLTFYAEEDPQWEEYREMCETEITMD